MQNGRNVTVADATLPAIPIQAHGIFSASDGNAGADWHIPAVRTPLSPADSDYAGRDSHYAPVDSHYSDGDSDYSGGDSLYPHQRSDYAVADIHYHRMNSDYADADSDYRAVRSHYAVADSHYHDGNTDYAGADIRYRRMDIDYPAARCRLRRVGCGKRDAVVVVHSLSSETTLHASDVFCRGEFIRPRRQDRVATLISPAEGE